MAWSDLSTGSYKLATDKGPVFLGDGAEYKFSVTGAPGNARFKWSVSPSGGIHSAVLGQTTESSSLTWQAPMSGSSYEVKVEAWVPGGEEGGDTLKGRWAESLTIPFLDVYLKDGEDKHHGEAYLPVGGGATEQVFAFVGVAEAGAGLEGIKVWWEDGGSSGSPGTWSPQEQRTNPAGDASTTFTVGESAEAGDYQIVKGEIKTAPGAGGAGAHVTDKNAPKINIFGVEINSLSPSPLVLGYGDLDIQYTIKPEVASFEVDHLYLDIYNAGEELLYAATFVINPELRKGGTHTIVWSGQKGDSPYKDCCVNANNNPYEAKITIIKDDKESTDAKNALVKAKAISSFASTSWFERQNYSYTAGEIATLIDELGYNEVQVYGAMNKSQAVSGANERLAWYLLSHGAGGKVELTDGHILEPADLPSGLNYTLVFMNACQSATGEAHAFADKFNAKAYVGWGGNPSLGVAAGFAERFFEELKGFHTVQHAINEAQIIGVTDIHDPKAIRGANVLLELP